MSPSPRNIFTKEHRMATSVKFMGYDIKSDPPSLEHRKTNGFLQTDIKLLQDLGLIDLSTGTTTPSTGISIPEIGEFLNWIASGQSGEIPPSAKRILCTRLQTLKNPQNLPNATKQFANGIVKQLELLVGDCSKVDVIPTATPAIPVKPVSSGLSFADLQRVLSPLETKIMAHIDAKFATHRSETEALKELLKTEIAKQLQAEDGLPKIERAFDAKMSALGRQIDLLKTSATASSVTTPALSREGSSFSVSSQSVQSPQSARTPLESPLESSTEGPTILSEEQQRRGFQRMMSLFKQKQPVKVQNQTQQPQSPPISSISTKTAKNATLSREGSNISFSSQSVQSPQPAARVPIESPLTSLSESSTEGPTLSREQQKRGPSSNYMNPLVKVQNPTQRPQLQPILPISTKTAKNARNAERLKQLAFAVKKPTIKTRKLRRSRK